jgi:hypothetical protein
MEQFPLYATGKTPPIGKRSPKHLDPCTIVDYHALTKSEIQKLQQQFFSEDGVTFFAVQNPEDPPSAQHPLHDLAQQLKAPLQLHFSIDRPEEASPAVIKRYGRSDGTFKIYDTGAPFGVLSNQAAVMHQDGGGNCGDIAAVAIYADNVAEKHCDNYFANLALIALELALEDPAAFTALFLPDALTVVTTGKRKLKISAPIMSLYAEQEPHAFFRREDNDHLVTWRDDCPELRRARAFFDEYTQPLSPGSTVLRMNSVGMGFINRNRLTIHGRSSFEDELETGRARRLSKKWFGTIPESKTLRCAPGIRIAKGFSGLYHNACSADSLTGNWEYDVSSDCNVRRR